MKQINRGVALYPSHALTNAIIGGLTNEILTSGGILNGLSRI